ncbi:MAG: SOS response-associated peptidase [Planctomycetes bacterium]|nr:SOS response-associated peptidase [Planctomycetota bacterium]
MCGRYNIIASAAELAELFGIDLVDWTEPRYNVAPTQMAPIIRIDSDSENRKFEMLKWGMMPRWLKVPKPIINVRSETIMDKPTFRKSFEERRCLVPATGFYEWQKLGSAKQPFHIFKRDEPIFAFAGIWDRFKGADDEMIESYAILTTSPNEVTAPIHNRMPVILDPAGCERWLDPGIGEAGALADLFEPISADQTIAEPVSSHVNSATHDDERCIEPLAKGV